MSSTVDRGFFLNGLVTSCVCKTLQEAQKALGFAKLTSPQQLAPPDIILNIPVNL